MKHIVHTAYVTVELHRTINATPETLWRLHTDVNAWPSWNAGITKAVLRGPFTEGNAFDWDTPSLSISSTIAQVHPLRRTVWGGLAHGIQGVHIWTFQETEDGTRVTSQESWTGEPVEADPDGMGAALSESMHGWLDALKFTAERTYG
ncbi:SRPBCC family protein [Wenjunlia tyrosinilytica]|uniref:Shy6-polyketide cyclase n=1 Tax=Wenjunlia tyrosinilytica TaxID=1544741 RepID=A0A918DYU6_9ACTN|nr:SRPBCC family protein [Wenjunlia tyrosinilytica]GGO93325.1 hypothetical protein GCM10012280_45600 [Wenjunlia tyrosinilytica]